MKKIVFIIILLIPLSVKANTFKNDNGIEIKEEEYERLKNLGFSENEIKLMPEYIFEENKNLIGSLESTETKYYKTEYYGNLSQTFMVNAYTASKTIEISEEEYNEGESLISPLDVSDSWTTEYKKMTTSIIKVGSTYRVKNELYWKKMPFIRSVDIIAIGINHAVVEPKAKSQRAYTSYAVEDACMCTCTPKTTNHSSDSGWDFSPNGYAVKFQLPKDGSKTYTWGGYTGNKYPCLDQSTVMETGKRIVNLEVIDINTTMYYDLVKIINGPLSAYGGYKHATSAVSFDGLSFGVTMGSDGASFGISINASNSKKYDSMRNVHVQVENPTW